MNEITQIARTVGPDWAAPEYDKNGNMTTIPQPKEPTATYKGTWDAWNRLAKLNDGPTFVQANRYDGLNRRIEQITMEESRVYFYSNAWQVLEEHSAGVSGSSSSSSSGSSPLLMDRQFVWGLRYIDDLDLRDLRATLVERLYAMEDANWNIVVLTSAL